MIYIAYLVAFVFTILAAGCLLLVLLGLPGTWLMLILAVLVELIDTMWLGAEDKETFGWLWIGVCAVLALLGEVLETMAGAVGTRKGGGTKRGMIGAIIGGIIGAIVLTPFIPIPILGTLIGALIGTFVGALIGEMTGKDQIGGGAVAKAALGATIGRLFGTMGKFLIGVVVFAVLVVTAFWP
mgnify:CR=1 FL=1